MSAIPLKQQAAEMRLIAREQLGHCEIIAGHVAKNRRPKHDLDRAQFKLAIINAAASTLTALERCADEVRPIIARNMGATDAAD